MKAYLSFKKVYLLFSLFFLLLVNSCETQVSNLKIVNAQTAFKIETKTVGNCKQSIPADWLSNTNNEGSAIDLYDANRTMYAGWGITAINSNMAIYYDPELYNINPERSVLRMGSLILAGVFSENAFLSFTNEIDEQINDYRLRSVLGGSCKGVVLYKIFPGDNINFNYIEAVRFALTKSNLWDQKGELVAGVAASISCNTIYVPHESPSLPKRASLKSSTSKDKKDDYGYNPQLGTEYCHNPKTGENFRVSPSINWSENGPDGPGYYGTSGNETIKMSPGRSD